MGEDIKILKDYLGIFKRNKSGVGLAQRHCNELSQAIENLIKGYKANKQILKNYVKVNKELHKDLDNSIPKSKVKEKIEELKIKIEDYKNMANTSTDRVDKRIICDQIEELKTTIKYLQELLEE